MTTLGSNIPGPGGKQSGHTKPLNVVTLGMADEERPHKTNVFQSFCHFSKPQPRPQGKPVAHSVTQLSLSIAGVG